MANLGKLRHSTEVYNDGENRGFLTGQESEHGPKVSPWRLFWGGSRGNLLRLVALSLCSLLLGLSLGNLKNYQATDLLRSSSSKTALDNTTAKACPTLTPSPTTELAPRKTAGFHLLLPENTASDNLCKVILTANLLGYPRPTILNWGEAYFDQKLRGYGSHTAKITGALHFLQGLDESQQDDFVLLIDALDAWFQLRPSVMIERFHEINRQGNDRIRQQMGPWNMESENIRSRVVISSQKSCFPVAPDDPGCALLPESTLPKKLYGNGTDILIPGEPFEQPARFYRYPHLNSGSMLGTVADMKKIFERAASYIKDGPHDYKGSDQGIFADILGEQEVYRSIITAHGEGNGEDAPSYESFNMTEGTNYEFGITLDYESTLVLATNAGLNETEWIYYNDPEKIAKLSQKHGMKYPHVGRLTDDVLRSTPPFENYPISDSSAGGPGVDEVTPLKDLTWAEVPLFTSLRTGYTPVVVHHNDWPFGAKKRIITMWNETWYQPYARTLFNLGREQAADEAVAAEREGETTDGGDGEDTAAAAAAASGPTVTQKRKWSMGTWEQDGVLYEWLAERGADGVLHTDKGKNLAFDEVCADSFKVLFADQRDGA